MACILAGPKSLVIRRWATGMARTMRTRCVVRGLALLWAPSGCTPRGATGPVEDAIMLEAEAADLVPLKAVVPRLDVEGFRHAEHADLLIQIAQVRDFEHLGEELEGV